MKIKARFTPCHNLKLIHGGSEFFDLLIRQIDEAKNTIHLQIYIFSDDSTGQLVANALMEAAKRKVDVFLLVDGFASQDLSKEFIKQLEDSGIHFRFFEPLLKSTKFYFGRRLHHKLIAIDGNVAITGGLNIADRYNDSPEERAWLDYALMVEGEVAHELFKVCISMWERKKFPILRIPKKIISKDKPLEDEPSMVRIRRNDWVLGKEQIWNSYSELFANARDNIIILGSYFLPGTGLRKRLRQAAKRGVEIKVILAGMSDVKIAKHAERYLYRWMLRHHIRVFEYQPTVLHAKIATADGRVMTAGSFNINDISTFASVELNLDIKNTVFVQQVERELEEIRKNDCVEVSASKINIFSFKHFVQLLSYYFIRVSLKLSTFYFRQKE